ncbi:MAG: hypothetical protein ABIN61_03210 [candidate division WOR-3 bacterium]
MDKPKLTTRNPKQLNVLIFDFYTKGGSMKKLSLVVVLLLVSWVAYGQGGWTDDGTVVRLTTSSDKVGIGTANPEEKLEVNGNLKISGNYKITSGGNLTIEGSPGSYSPATLKLNSSSEAYLYGGTGGGDQHHVILAHTGSQAWGRVGIRKTNPSYELDVAGTVQMTGFRLPTGAMNGYVLTSNGSGVGTWQLQWLKNGNNIYYNAGKVGIGVTNPQSELTVNGVITTKEIKVKLTGWPDFVFADNYRLMPLNKLEQHIKKEKSLPGIPTAKEVTEEGIPVGELQAKLLEKVEELTLYVIKQNKELTELKKELGDLRRENRELRQKISKITR